MSVVTNKAEIFNHAIQAAFAEWFRARLRLRMMLSAVVGGVDSQA